MDTLPVLNEHVDDTYVNTPAALVCRHPNGQDTTFARRSGVTHTTPSRALYEVLLERQPTPVYSSEKYVFQGRNLTPEHLWRQRGQMPFLREE